MLQLLDEKWIYVHYTAIHATIIKSAKKQTVSFRMNNSKAVFLHLLYIIPTIHNFTYSGKAKSSIKETATRFY